MKKIIKILALVLVATLSLAALVACGMPKDPEKAKKNLEDNGYEAGIIDGDDLDDFIAIFGLEKGDIEAIVSAAKADDSNDRIVIVYCKDSSVVEKVLGNNAMLPPNQGAKGSSGSICWSGSKAAIDAAQ